MSITNCPNCGAPVVSNKCDYCGTYIFDFSQIKMGEPCWISVDLGNGCKRLLNVILNNASVDADYNEISFYADNKVVKTLGVPDITLDMSFYVVGEDKTGILSVMKGE
jgi:predicted GTPase